MRRSKSVLLLSAGLDSAYNLYRAVAESNVILALTFNYGQKAAIREERAAKMLSDNLKIPHLTLDLPWFANFTHTSLIADSAIPQGNEVSIDDKATSLKTMKAVWVPNRNGIFLNIAAGFAEGAGAEFIVPGFNVEEAATFPDNSQEYLSALDASFQFSTQSRVKTKCYSTSLNKTEIVREGLKLKLPLKSLWPCYSAFEKWCGVCESCQRFRRAVQSAGAADQVKDQWMKEPS